VSPPRPPHLICRAGTFYVRVRVPRDLVPVLGVVEIKRSLHVGRLSEARLLGPACAARLKETFNMIREGQFTGDGALELIRRCFADLAREVGHGYRPATADLGELHTSALD